MMKVITIGLIAIMGLWGCSKKHTKIEIDQGYTEPKPVKQIILAPEPEPERKIVPAIAEIKEDRVILKPNDVYFKFDSYDIPDNLLDDLAYIAEILLKDHSLYVHIDGYTCPIGTYEYNLALGEQRGLACQKYLVDFGVRPERIVVTSYGEEESKLNTNEYAKYWINRRAEFEFLK